MKPKKVTKKKIESKRKTLHKKLWKMWSLLVRVKNSDWRGYGKCFTCGVVKHYTEMQASHRYHNKLDFDPINVHSCCIKCNNYLSGNLGEYERNLVKIYGQEIADNLHLRANQFIRYSYEDLLELEKTIKSFVDKYSSNV